MHSNIIQFSVKSFEYPENFEAMVWKELNRVCPPGPGKAKERAYLFSKIREELYNKYQLDFMNPKIQ